MLPPGGLSATWKGVAFRHHLLRASTAGVDFGLEKHFSNPRIEVTQDGILAVYRLRRQFAPWAKLSPLKDSLLNQTGFLFDRAKGRRPQLIVTFEQMRAIWAHPACPKWTLTPILARRPGVSQTASSGSNSRRPRALLAVYLLGRARPAPRGV
jgi:hypothetical protein